MILDESLFEDFYDYGTGPVSGTDVIDLHTTGFSYYNDFLSKNKSDYLRHKHNLVGEVVMMSPEEYYEACAKYGYIDGVKNVDRLKYHRRLDKGVLDHLKDVLLVAKKK